MIQTDGEVRTVNKGHVGLRKYMLEGKTLLRDYEQDNYFLDSKIKVISKEHEIIRVADC